MLFKTITKDNFTKFINGVIEKNVTIAPVIKDRDSEGNPVYQFDQVYSFDELELKYTKSYSSVKNFFLPYIVSLTGLFYQQCH